MPIISKNEYKLLNTIRSSPGFTVSKLSTKLSMHPDVVRGIMQTVTPELYILLDVDASGERTYSITPRGLQALTDYEEEQKTALWKIGEKRTFAIAGLILAIPGAILAIYTLLTD